LHGPWKFTNESGQGSVGITNQGFHRDRLSPLAIAARKAFERDNLHAIADKGYFNGAEIVA